MGSDFSIFKKKDIIEKNTIHLVDLQWLWKNRRKLKLDTFFTMWQYLPHPKTRTSDLGVVLTKR